MTVQVGACQAPDRLLTLHDREKEITAVCERWAGPGTRQPAGCAVRGVRGGAWGCVNSLRPLPGILQLALEARRVCLLLLFSAGLQGDRIQGAALYFF